MYGSCRRSISFAVLVLLAATLACNPATPAAGVAPANPRVLTPSVPVSVPTAARSAVPAAGPWHITRGQAKSDQAWGIDTDKQGNLYWGTYQQEPGELFTDMVIYKLAPDGKEIWSTRWGSQYQEKLFIVVAGDPEVLVAGLRNTSVNPNESEMVVLALDAGDGHVAWEFTWSQGRGYEEVDGLVVDGDAIYVSGWTTGAKTGNDLAILKLSRQGKLVWSSTWGSAGWDQADGQMVVDDDTIYVAGRYNGANILLGGQALLARFRKQDGAHIDHVTWGGALGNDALGMTSDGADLYVVGLTVVNNGGGQIFVRKYDKDLRLIWEQLWGGKGGESARAIAVTPDGQVLVAGETYSYGAGDADAALLLYDRDGNLQWSRTWGGPEKDGFLGMKIAGDYVYLTGATHSFGAGQNDALLIKALWSTGALPPTP